MNLTKDSKAKLDELIQRFRDEISKNDWDKEIEVRIRRRHDQYSRLASQVEFKKIDFAALKEMIMNLWALNGWNNKAYFVEAKIRLNEESFSQIKAELDHLLFGSNHVAERLCAFIDNTSGMRLPFATELLYLSNPDNYPMYNAKSQSVLSHLSLLSTTLKNANTRRNTKEGYKAFCDIYGEILAYIRTQLPEIKSFQEIEPFFWMLKFEEEEGDTEVELVDDNEPRLRIIRMGSHKDFEYVREAFENKGVAGFGFDEIVEYDPKVEEGYNFNSLKKVMTQAGAKRGKINKISGYIKQFAMAKTNRDWVIAVHRGHIHGYGEIAKPYFKDLTFTGFEHCIGVNWTWLDSPLSYKRSFSTAVSEELSKSSSVSVVKKESARQELLNFINKGLPNSDRKPNIQIVTRGNVSLEDISRATYIPVPRLEELIQTFGEENGKGQVIFDGPPGTGKTFVATKLAQYLSQEEGKPEGAIKIITCHSALNFEQMFQGLYPTESGKITTKNGLITEFLENASENEEANYVLVLDEINRCNLSHVFGPLLYLLENRDEAVSLPLDGEQITLPSNVYIIATMNSDDRSTGLVDFAFRRRFAHFRFDPDADVLKSWLQARHPSADVDLVVNLFNLVNEKLQKIDPQFKVGHSFFMVNNSPSIGVLQRLWETEIIPYLAERFYHDRSVLEAEFALTKLIKTVKSMLNTELSEKAS